jgi:hypothetical protein
VPVVSFRCTPFRAGGKENPDALLDPKTKLGFSGEGTVNGVVAILLVLQLSQISHALKYSNPIPCN